MADTGTTRAMRLLHRYFNAGFSGLVAGYSLAFVLSRSVWLEMRFTVGYVLPLFAVCFILAFGNRKQAMGFIPLTLFEVLAVCLLFALYGASSATLSIIPAALFRDGFHLNGLSLTTVNCLLLALTAGGNLSTVTAARKSTTETEYGGNASAAGAESEQLH